MVVNIYTKELVFPVGMVRVGTHHEILDNDDGIPQPILDQIQDELNRGDERGFTSECTWELVAEEDIRE